MTAVITQGSYDQKLLNAADFEKIVYLDFEGLKLMDPGGFDNLLRVWYGDYMQLPPFNERGNWHSDIIFDADTPYKEFLRKQGIDI